MADLTVLPHRAPYPLPEQARPSSSSTGSHTAHIVDQKRHAQGSLLAGTRQIMADGVLGSIVGIHLLDFFGFERLAQEGQQEHVLALGQDSTYHEDEDPSNGKQ